MLRFLQITLGLALSGAVHASPASGTAEIEIVSFVGSLFVVVVSILAFGWLYSRLRPGLGGGSDAIRVVAARPLGPRERLLVVEVSGEQILVGVSQGSMQTLHTLSQPIEERRPIARSEGSFAGRLKAMLREHAQ